MGSHHWEGTGLLFLFSEIQRNWMKTDCKSFSRMLKECDLEVEARMMNMLSKAYHKRSIQSQSTVPNNRTSWERKLSTHRDSVSLTEGSCNRFHQIDKELKVDSLPALLRKITSLMKRIKLARRETLDYTVHTTVCGLRKKNKTSHANMFLGI